MTKRTFLSEALLLGLLAVVLSACGNSEAQESARPGPQAARYPVLSVEPRAIELTRSYPATLEGQQTVEVRPRVEGYIVEMRVDEGDTVEKDQVLFRLNGEAYEQDVRSAEADVEAAEAAVQTAEDEVQRLTHLTEKGVISAYQLKAAQNTLQTRRAELSQARAALKNARVNLSYTYVRSPVSGVIGAIPYRIGSLVHSGIAEPLAVVSDVSNVYAYFSMSEGELLALSQGMERGGARSLRQHIESLPDVKLRLSDGTTYGYRGDVRLASGLIDTETGSASFRAVFPNPDHVLWSGATGTVQIPFVRDAAIAIPKSATYEIQDKRFVYRVNGDRAVESVEIQTAALSTDKLFVVEAGLSGGDRIVMEGMGGLQDGATIQPDLVNADSLYQAWTAEDQPHVAQADDGSAWQRQGG